MDELKLNLKKEYLAKGYILCDKIGEGGCSNVYKAQRINSDIFVAIKILKLPHYCSETRKLELIAYFKQCMKPYEFLKHSAVVRYFESGELTQGTPYAIFEYIPGDTLKQFCLGKKCMTPIETACIMRKVLEALTYAHSQGMVHGDLKPHNIMIFGSEEDLHVKLIDFGFYESMEGGENPSQAFLSPQYNAPEQLKGNLPTPQSDLYSWALIFLGCLTGVPAISGNSIAEIIRNHLSDQANLIPKEIRQHLLGNLLSRALNQEPSRRSWDAQNLLEEFYKLDFKTLPNCFSVNQQIHQLDMDYTIFFALE